MMFEIVKVKEGAEAGKLVWNLRLSSGGRIIAQSEQVFAKRSAALADIARVREIAPGAQTVEVL